MCASGFPSDKPRTSHGEASTDVANTEPPTSRSRPSQPLNTSPGGEDVLQTDDDHDRVQEQKDTHQRNGYRHRLGEARQEDRAQHQQQDDGDPAGMVEGHGHVRFSTKCAGRVR
jgi:hypothetical protein